MENFSDYFNKKVNESVSSDEKLYTLDDLKLAFETGTDYGNNEHELIDHDFQNENHDTTVFDVWFRDYFKK